MCDEQDLKLENYDFHLPNDLIALYPAKDPTLCRLLVYKNKEIIHTTFDKLFDFIDKKYLILLNDTKVINARFFANKMNTKREFLYHNNIDESSHLVQIKGKVRINDIFFCNDAKITILDSQNNGFWRIKIEKNNHALNKEEIFNFLEKNGKVPLPPYIKRETITQDSLNYQSLFAKNNGSIAAPTASLHFNTSMLKYLQSNYKYMFLTLHIGAGTFKKVESKNILNHAMHSEFCYIKNENLKILQDSKDILSIGTTALRASEFMCQNNISYGENNIFLHPLNTPKKIKSLLTNFHLPKSSLIMLVSSLIGRKETLQIYEEAIKNKYRFYSYGDCMLILQ